jgi:hypothetical protein
MGEDNIETFLAAARELEGEGWVRIQRESLEEDEPHRYTLGSAISVIVTTGHEDASSGDICIYGAGGIHRYWVSRRHAVRFTHGAPEQTRLAQRLGFATDIGRTS